MKKIILVTILAAACLMAVPVANASTLNKDGMAVVRLSVDEYNSIVNETPVISDKKLNDYVSGVANKLRQQSPALPKGVVISVTILNKKVPEIYSMANGTIMITSSAILAFENEAQLAAVLSHEVAHIAGSHYPRIYQAFKVKEKKARGGALAAGLAGAVVGAALDYTVMDKTQDVYADLDAGDISYREALKKTYKIEASAGVLEDFADVYQSLPPETKAGSGDPRVPLEMVADSEGLNIMAMAGYDPAQAGNGWRNLRKATDRAKAGSIEAMARSFLPPHMRSFISGVSGPMGGIRAEALTRTISQNPPDRPQLLDSLARSTKVASLKKSSPVTGRNTFKKVIGAFVMGDAKVAFDEGDYATSKQLYQAAWDSGYQTADIAYYLGRSQTGEFAFAASDREKEAAEEYLKKATKLDPRMPEPYRALGDLYSEWEMYKEAASMYRKYLKVSPKASDRSRIERQIGKMERKAKR